MTKPEEKSSDDTASTKTPDLYGKDYFEKYGTDCGPVPYTREDPRWAQFFGSVADELVRSLKPQTVLDVGCAIGFLIEAFWRKGVRAYGIDISEYAIGQVPQDLRSFCRVLSATEPLPEDFPQTYDLITCIEVLEHLTEPEGRSAINNMASRTSSILFSSTPHDLTEPTHVNVRPVIYWLQFFAEVGFYPDLRFDASFVSPQAFLLRKTKPTLEEDTLPFFVESINKKFQLNAQQEQITTLTSSNQELRRRLEEEVGKRDKEIENLRGDLALLTQKHHELGEQRDKEIENLRGDLALLTQKHHELGETLQQERIVRQTLQEQVGALEEEATRVRSTVQQMKQALEEKQTQIKDMTFEREKSFHDINQLQIVLSARDREIESLQVAQSGLFWELLVAYRGAKDRCLPPGTKRREWYDRCLSAMKATRNHRGRIDVVSLPLKHPVRTKFHKFGLIISGCPGDAFRYRCEHQAEQLRFFGLTVDTAYFDQVDYEAALESYECFWLHRVPHTEGVENFVRSAQDLGKPVIFDTDDLIFDEEQIAYIRALQWMPQEEVSWYYDGVRRYHRTLSLCRFASVTTEPLREAIQRLFPQIQCFINPNTLSDIQLAQAEEALKLSRSSEDKDVVCIAYFSGTHTHNVDFQVCSRALERILEAYPNARVMLVGHLDIGNEFERFGDRIERYPLLRWQELPRLFRKVDVNLAPLELENPFTEAKSALKYFEAGVMGVPTVASDVRAFRASIRHGENGFLCRTEQDWVQYLTQLVENADLRREMGRQARTDTLATLTTRRQAPHFGSVMREIVQASPLSSKKRLSITFVLRAPIAQVGGGYKVIFLLAHYLARRSHDVHLYVEPIAHLEGKSDSEIVEFCHRYFGASSAQIHVGHHSIADCDVAIATNWPTAYVVEGLTNAICKLYLIQDFEPDFYEYQSNFYKQAERTYSLPLKKIAIGRYLSQLFEERDRLPVAYFDFALDHEIFNAVGRQTSTHVPLGGSRPGAGLGGNLSGLPLLADGQRRPENTVFSRPSLKRRGYSVGVEALEKVHKAHPDVKLSLYGMEEKPKLPFPYVNLGVLDQKSLSEAMRDADIHLSFSFSNISQVPFQAMACGCAVVEAKVPSVEAMVENGKNCLLAEPAADSVAEAIIRLIRDAGLRRTITAAGLDFVREKTWENSCKQFESILFDSLLLREAEQQQEGSNSVLSQRKRVDHDSAHEFSAASGPDL